MIIYCVCYLTSFLLAQAGWDIPSGLMLIGAAMYVYWKDWRKTGNLIHLRGLFFLGFVGGQGISCFKLPADGMVCPDMAVFSDSSPGFLWGLFFHGRQKSGEMGCRGDCQKDEKGSCRADFA